MIIDQLPSVGTPALTDETVTEQGQNLFKVTWQRLLTLFKANTTPADIGAVDSAGAAEAAPVQSVNGMTGAVTIPSAPLSDDNPQPLGTASPGTSTNVSRADHVHAMPSADDVGALPIPTIIEDTWDGTGNTYETSAAFTVSGDGFITVQCNSWVDAGSSDTGSAAVWIIVNGATVAVTGSRLTAAAADTIGAFAEYAMQAVDGATISTREYHTKNGSKHVRRRFICYGCTVTKNS